MWKIERERCSKARFEKCGDNYEYTKVCAMYGKVYDECLAYTADYKVSHTLDGDAGKRKYVNQFHFSVVMTTKIE